MPNDEELRRDVVHRYHDTMTAGHPGESKTLELLERNYWWPRMGQYVRHYIATCDVCGRIKNRPAIAASLQPNKVPTKPWQIITAEHHTRIPHLQTKDQFQYIRTNASKGDIN